MKYLFEVEEEIKNCWFCPFSMIADFDDTKLHCKLIDKYISGDETPDDCSLQKVGIFNYEGGLATKQCNSL